MRHRKPWAAALALLLALALAGCGGSGKDLAGGSANQFTDSASYTEESAASAAETAEDAPGMERELAAMGRKVIVTAHVSAETEDYDGAMAWVKTALSQAGGRMENTEQYAHNQSRRSCQLTLRIPAGQLEGFLTELEGRCNVVERSVREEDVTLDYVDTESHKKALLVEQERLLELLAQADKLEDLLGIEDRLTQVRYQLQNYESALRVYDGQIDYSTVHMSLQEVRELTEPTPESWGSRALEGMKENARSIGRFFQELALFVVTHLPALALLGLLAGIILLCTCKPRRAARERRRQNREALEALRRQAQEPEGPKNPEDS